MLDGVVVAGTAVSAAALGLIGALDSGIVVSGSGGVQASITNSGGGGTNLIRVGWEIFGERSSDTSGGNCLSSSTDLGGNSTAASVSTQVILAGSSLVSNCAESGLSVPSDGGLTNGESEEDS